MTLGVRHTGGACGRAPAAAQQRGRDFVPRQKTYLFKHFCKALRSDKYVAMEAIKYNISNLKWVSSNLKNKKSFMDKVIEHDEFGMEYAYHKTRNDREY